MADNSRIKVAGYSQAINYGNGIEYRPFSPDLVGLQLTSTGDTSLFTMGNFVITTNMEPKVTREFVTNKFSNFVTLTDLDLSVIQSKALLSVNATPTLNLDKTNIKYYALFGSLVEFVRVALENIITTWPAGLYIQPSSQTSSGQILNGYTYEDYSYDSITNIASFKIDTNFIVNKYLLNYVINGKVVDTFNADNPLRNIESSYLAYSVLLNGVEYPVVGFTGSTTELNDYIYFDIKGDVFSGYGTSSKVVYHIKPQTIYNDTFFNLLEPFNNYLLSRNIIPLYTSVFKYPIVSDSGIVLYITKSITWPVTDGYNLDFDTTEYFTYVTQLLEIAENSDLVNSDLMNRFLVTESISDYDTTPVYLAHLDQDSTGQKMNKTLRIYGREYDELNNYIEGIKFANTVTYNKANNTPDVYLKQLASVMGWGLISSVTENDLLANYVSSSQSTYSGQSVGLTPVEADIELWKRLILNTPWIWKSKGARKSIEFILNFIGAPLGLVTLNEYIYVADGPINVELFEEIIRLNEVSTDLSDYPIDSDGYPRPMPDTPEMYFQNMGLWHRETGGINSVIDIPYGNNPHIGTYDGGSKYINQFRELIPDFSPVVISSDTISTTTLNLYLNNNYGTFDTSVTSSNLNTVDFSSPEGLDLTEFYIFNQTVELDPLPSELSNKCGCTTGEEDKTMSLCIEKRDPANIEVSPCGSVRVGINNTTGFNIFAYKLYNQDGSFNTTATSDFVRQECCQHIGGTPILKIIRLNPYDDTSEIVDYGYMCQGGTTI